MLMPHTAWPVFGSTPDPPPAVLSRRPGRSELKTTFFALVCLAACWGCGGGGNPKAAIHVLPQNLKTPVAHVFLVIEENHSFTAVAGDKVIPGVKVNTPYRHENTLRTIMELLGLTDFPGASADAAPMNDFFQ